MPSSKKIFVHGPGFPELRCTFANPDCLAKHDVTIIGNGDKRVGVDQLPEDLGENPMIYLHLDSMHFQGFDEPYFALAPLVTSLKSYDDFHTETTNETLVPQTVFLKKLSKRLGSDSKATILLATCRFGEKAQKEIKKFLPAGVTLIATSNNIERLSVTSPSLDYISETISAPRDEIIERTLTHYGSGTCLIHDGKIIRAASPKTIPSHAGMKAHLQTELTKFGLGEITVSDDSTTQYSLGVINERLANKLLTDAFVSSVATSDIDTSAVLNPTAERLFGGILEKHLDGYKPASKLLNATRPSFQATIDEPFPLTGNTLLTNAVIRNKVEAVIELTGAGANPNTRSAEGFTPLMIAAHLGHLKVADILLRNERINLDETLELYSALGFASIKGDTAMTKKLLQAGATNCLFTAFDLAISQTDKNEAEELIKLCLDNGFRPAEVPDKFKEFVGKYLAEKDASTATSAEYVVDAREGVAAPESELSRNAAPPIATTPAAVSAAAPPPPGGKIAQASPTPAATAHIPASISALPPAAKSTRPATTATTPPTAAPSFGSSLFTALAVAAQIDSSQSSSTRPAASSSASASTKASNHFGATEVLEVATALGIYNSDLTKKLGTSATQAGSLEEKIKRLIPSDSPAPTPSQRELDGTAKSRKAEERAVLFELGQATPLPEMTLGREPTVVHQTKAEEESAHKEKLDRAGQKAATARESGKTSWNMHPKSSRPATGKPGKQGHR
jgi:hypothetical protein